MILNTGKSNTGDYSVATNETSTYASVCHSMRTFVPVPIIIAFQSGSMIFFDFTANAKTNIDDISHAFFSIIILQHTSKISIRYLLHVIKYQNKRSNFTITMKQ